MTAYYPDKPEFARRARQGNLTPVYREILADMETPVSAFKKICGAAYVSGFGSSTSKGECNTKIPKHQFGSSTSKSECSTEIPKHQFGSSTSKSECNTQIPKHQAYSFLLESVEGGERMARFSFLGSGADRVISSKGNKVEISRDGQTQVADLEPAHDVLDVLKQEMGRFSYVPDPDLPRFCGGAVGFISYDMVRFFEDLPDSTTDDLGMPDCTFVFTDTLLIFDHVRHRIRVVCNARIDDDVDASYEAAIAKIDHIVEQLRQPVPAAPAPKAGATPEVSSNFTREGYEAAVRKCQEYIAAGDVIQVVPSQRFSTKVTADSFDVYRALRSLNPSPYMYYLAYGDTKLIGSSPEILVTEERGNVTVRPIAGTRWRGATQDEDKELADELLKDEKERAEHIMLVDLGRNDIGRVCRYGSVEVDELMVIERYSHVMHIVSNVKGRLQMDKDQFDLLRACFPAGTVSGAPKIRAMEIIDEVEPTRRGTYAGAIGYFSYSGDMDTCITIRTILIQGDTAYIQAGAGIVADSVPAREFEETQNKAMAMIKAIELAEGGLE